MLKYRRCNPCEIGYRFRKCRKEKKVSQEELIYKLKAMGIEIGRDTLSDFENGKSINNVTLYQVLGMCDCLDISLPYLLGEYNAKTGDRQQIIDTLGISEKALENIDILDEYSQDTLSIFLENQFLCKVLDAIRTYQVALSNYNEAIREIIEVHSGDNVKKVINENMYLDEIGDLHRFSYDKNEATNNSYKNAKESLTILKYMTIKTFDSFIASLDPLFS